MKKEYGRWVIYIKEMEKYISFSSTDPLDRETLMEIRSYALENGFTDAHQDIKATEIIKKYKMMGY